MDINNDTSQTLTLERIHIPPPGLSLYQNTDGVLWTQPVTLGLSKNSKTVEFNIGRRLPAEAGKVKKLTQGREKEGRLIFTKSLAAFMGG